LKEVFALQRDLKLIFFAHFLWDCGHGLYYFILPVYIRGLGATILEVGLFYLLMHAVYFSTMIFGGLLADRFDRKKTGTGLLDPNSTSTARLLRCYKLATLGSRRNFL